MEPTCLPAGGRRRPRSVEHPVELGMVVDRRSVQRLGDFAQPGGQALDAVGQCRGWVELDDTAPTGSAGVVSSGWVTLRSRAGRPSMR